jgi:sugar lactone lactonase YvrE
MPSGFSTFAGLAQVQGSVDGIGRLARFSGPSGLTVDAGGNVFIADPASSTIRKITSTSSARTVAGFAGSTGSADGPVSGALFSGPCGVAVDNQGNLFVTDTQNHTIRRITRSGFVSTFAGLAGVSGTADGQGSDARFCFPLGIAIDQAGNLYVSCQGTSTLRKISPQGEVSTLAGLAGKPGSADGTGSSARFLCPNGIAVDDQDNLYIADQNNSTIRKITANGTVTTLAGLAGTTGCNDGLGNQARFNYPASVAVDKAGNVYVADTYNATIRKISPAGLVTTFAGLAGQVGIAEGPGPSARFNNPNGVAMDQAGNLYVTDTGNSTVRKYAPAEIEPPELRAFSLGGDFVVLWWSSLWHGYLLESRVDFLPGTSWVPVSQAPANIDGMLFLTNDLPAPSSAFRLRNN